MEFHISRTIRESLELDEVLFSYTGNVIFANVGASRRLAAKLTEARFLADPEAQPVHAGALFAMGLIDELNHALIARYRKEIDPAVLSDALTWFSAQFPPKELEHLLLAFTHSFPNAAIFRGELTPAAWLAGSTDDLLNREAALEELLLLSIANRNPAFAPFHELFRDTDLRSQAAYKELFSALPTYFDTRPQLDPEAGSLLDALEAPFLSAPTSLNEQLEFIRGRWSKLLKQDLRPVLLAIDTLREEDTAIWMRFHPPGPDHHRHGTQGGGGREGFVGDEFVGLNDDFDGGPGEQGRRGRNGARRYATDYQAPLNEYEAFSADQAWMPNVVLIAKSTYVWLEQLSKKYGRHIHRLDHIPDEELRLMADRGITGLWLIGLWERSAASQTIKHLRGHADAVASAYSLKDYRIADDLGGNAAYESLRDRAGSLGLRLASDMVPNHMGIDSDWVIEHPDWFIHRWESPFPVYSFEGPDLSNDSRVEIKIEDHYYDQTDAAVAFRLRTRADGSTRYLYHGNDGTTFAWNDTAQLDYSKAAVREVVIQTILHVARLFPIIRFDAAMVLAKRHVQRLWFPLPGAGGSIPSRAEDAMSQEEFERLMPHEFWRDVVDRVAAEVPGTLLLAEAFWLLEGYFVRTLGMHRVYNSAFMNMLRDEENAKYRSYLKKTIEFDPDILKRYVNFMSNPDERTAIDQFGSGDKFFGTSTLLATLPGLPMFGHGQIEGYSERYGMEFKQAKQNEWPNDDLVARHQHEIAPLLKRREIFAESANFLLYDFWNRHGTVDENVFAYSNRLGSERSIILYNNSYQSTSGSIHISAASTDKRSGEQRQRSIVEGLDLPGDDTILAFRDTANGLEYLRRASDFREYGFTLDLRGYQYAVLLNWRELRSSTERPWDRLCDALGGAGVHSVDEALSKLRLRPLHEALRHAISAQQIAAFVKAAQGRLEDVIAASLAIVRDDAQPNLPEQPADLGLDMFVQQSQLFFTESLNMLPHEPEVAQESTSELLQEQTSSKSHITRMAGPAASYRAECEALTLAATYLPALEEKFSSVWPASVRRVIPSSEAGRLPETTWALVLAWIVLHSLPWNGKRAARFDQLQLRSALAEIFSSLGLEWECAWKAAAQLRVLLHQDDVAGNLGKNSSDFWGDPDVRWLAGVNEAAGVTYLNKERFEEFNAWLQLPSLTEPGARSISGITAIEDTVDNAQKTALLAGYKLRRYLELRESLPLETLNASELSSQSTAHETLSR